MKVNEEPPYHHAICKTNYVAACPTVRIDFVVNTILSDNTPEPIEFLQNCTDTTARNYRTSVFGIEHEAPAKKAVIFS